MKNLVIRVHDMNTKTKIAEVKINTDQDMRQDSKKPFKSNYS